MQKTNYIGVQEWNLPKADDQRESKKMKWRNFVLTALYKDMLRKKKLGDWEADNVGYLKFEVYIKYIKGQYL